jgi:transcription elongation GreA/GreB family factor
VQLTADGLELLARRAAHLREVVLPELRPHLVARERDERVVADFERLSAEAARLDRIVATTTVLPAYPEDGIVHPGSRVLIELPDGETEWVRPVHDVEAFLDDERVSLASPLSRALLGARVTDVVEVDGPSGTWACRVLDVARTRPAGARRRRRTAAT